jgi:hypothetical protein
MPPPGFTTSQGRLGPNLPPKGNRAELASPHGGFSGVHPDAGQVNLPTTGDNAPTSLSGAGLGAWCGNFMAMLGGVSVNHSS